MNVKRNNQGRKQLIICNFKNCMTLKIKDHKGSENTVQHRNDLKYS